MGAQESTTTSSLKVIFSHPSTYPFTRIKPGVQCQPSFARAASPKWRTSTPRSEGPLHLCRRMKCRWCLRVSKEWMELEEVYHHTPILATDTHHSSKGTVVITRATWCCLKRIGTGIRPAVLSCSRANPRVMRGSSFWNNPSKPEHQDSNSRYVMLWHANKPRFSALLSWKRAKFSW
jgi:hypothetical protein